MHIQPAMRLIHLVNILILKGCVVHGQRVSGPVLTSSFKILSTFVATCSVFIGLYYGFVLQQFQFHSQRVVQWVVPSIIQLALGFIIHFTFMPFNKNLYTISYIFLMGGTAGLVFILCYILMDVAKFQFPGMPFVWLGSNSIILYCGDDLLPVLIGPSGFVLLYYGSMFEIFPNRASYSFCCTGMDNNFGSWARATFFDSWLPHYTANLIWALCRACFWILPAFVLFRKKYFVRV
jgi:predicted acyltransferase